jgi:DNA invertase Pin-like site-specific DNA recombinase
METKVVSYLRCSTKRQGESGLGIEAQREYVRSYCARVTGSVLKEFVEIESGKKCDRDVLKAAIAYAKRTKSTLVIAKIDRLARNVAFVANLMETRVKFEACDMPGANDMTIHVMAAVAENEAHAISKRTKDALAAAKTRGTLLGSHNKNAVPLSRIARAKGQKRGAASNQKRAIAEYADLLPAMRQLRDSGRSLRSVAEYLNEENYRTRNDSRWTATQVMRVLQRGD